MKKTFVALAAVTILASMIPFAFANGDGIDWPCDTPGRTPGYWKHQIKVYKDLTNGKYSWYFDDVKMDDDYMAAIEDRMIDWYGVDFDDALLALEATGPGSGEIRHDMAFMLNNAANLDEYDII